ncbi:hypothetical protein [Halomonas nitroreducens]|uniref:Uncharacterized protein n=1 Tax=Halomonas nitroreducens TaxID=447425 RepID=A0A431V6U5_9GAMM|nr:hypothetical protein [Halomonas nitroreducens]RTR05634.1 hypothetical protein EKG36_05960 [Halomonas nitroreducens]
MTLLDVGHREPVVTVVRSSDHSVRTTATSICMTSSDRGDPQVQHAKDSGNWASIKHRSPLAT